MAGIIWKIYGLNLCSIAYEVTRGGGGRKRYVKWSELFVWCCVIFKEPLRKEYNAVHSRVDVLPSFP